MLEKSNCPAAAAGTVGSVEVEGTRYVMTVVMMVRAHPSLCGCRTSGLHTKAVTASAAPGISFTNPAHELGGGEHGAITLALARV